jgi:uncharacterized membrane protein (DUF2068 family)
MADSPSPQEHAGLRVIALFKLAKGLLLILAALGSFQLINRDLDALARLWARHLNIDPENHLARWVFTQASEIKPNRLRHFGYILLLFALDQLVEGYGLWFNYAWAKYLLLAATSFGFIWESFQLLRDPSIIHIVGVAFASCILLYLWWMFRADRRGGARPPGAL